MTFCEQRTLRMVICLNQTFIAAIISFREIHALFSSNGSCFPTAIWNHQIGKGPLQIYIFEHMHRAGASLGYCGLAYYKEWDETGTNEMTVRRGNSADRMFTEHLVSARYCSKCFIFMSLCAFYCVKRILFSCIFLCIYVCVFIDSWDISKAHKPLLGNWLPLFPKGIDLAPISSLLLRTADRLIMIHYEVDANRVNIFSTWLKMKIILCLHIFIRNHNPFDS